MIDDTATPDSAPQLDIPLPVGDQPDLSGNPLLDAIEISDEEMSENEDEERVVEIKDDDDLPAADAGKPHKIKIQFKTSKATLGQKKDVEPEKKKSMAAEIFEKEDSKEEEENKLAKDISEAEEKIAKTNEEILKEMRQKSSQKLSIVAEIFGSETENGSDQEIFKKKNNSQF